MNFFVEKKVLDLGLKIKFVVIENINNLKEINYFEKNNLNELIKKYENINLEEDEILKGYHKIHENGNISKRKNIPASENLIRLLIEKKTMYNINPIVDIYNYISIKTKICLGAHDIDKTDGDVTLRFHNGLENYKPIGINTSSNVKLNEYSYIDSNNDILCRLEVRQVEKTKITEKSKNVFYIVEGNDKTTDEYLVSVCNEIISETTKILGGKGYIEEVKII